MGHRVATFALGDIGQLLLGIDHKATRLRMISRVVWLGAQSTTNGWRKDRAVAVKMNFSHHKFSLGDVRLQSRGQPWSFGPPCGARGGTPRLEYRESSRPSRPALCPTWSERPNAYAADDQLGGGRTLAEPAAAYGYEAFGFEDPQSLTNEGPLTPYSATQIVLLRQGSFGVLLKHSLTNVSGDRLRDTPLGASTVRALLSCRLHLHASGVRTGPHRLIT